MLGKIMRFEFLGRMQKVSTHVFFLLLTAIGYIAVLRSSGPLRLLRIKPGELTPLNSPYILFFLINITTTLGILITAAYFGKAAHRDFKYHTHELLFSLPVKKRDYVTGRFCGAVLSTLFVFSGVGLGAWLASLFPAWNADRIVHVPIWAYLQPYLIAVFPNIILVGTLSFLLILSTRKFFPVYAGLTGLLFLYIMAASLGNTHQFFAASLLDPFGLIGSQSIYMYWNVAQKNSLLIPLEAGFLINRLIWMGAAIFFLAVTFIKFKASAFIEDQKGTKRKPGPNGLLEQDSWIPDQIRSRPDLNFNPSVRLKQMLFTTWKDFSGLMHNVYFLVILGLGFLMTLVLGFRNVGLIRGTPSLPVTSQVLDVYRVPVYLFSLLVILFSSGELIWKERNKGVSPISDSLPIPEWVFFLGKWGAMMLVHVVIASITLLSSLGTQIMQGYYRFEIPLYLIELFGVRWVYFSLLSVFALFIQVIVNRRFPAYILSLLLVDDLMPSLGLQHHLWRFGSSPWHTYTEMNGYGPFVKPLIAFNAYWAAFSLILIIFSLLFWVRGYDRGIKHRLKQLRQRFNRTKGTVLFLSLASCLFLGGFIIYNTSFLNRFETTGDRDRMCAEYEKQYKHLDALPQPKIISLNTHIDLYPKKRRLRVRGTMSLANRSDSPIKDIIVHIPRDAEIHNLGWEKSSTVTFEDPRFGLIHVTLADALPAGEVTRMMFDLEFAEKGFPNHSRPETWSLPQTALVRNGSFFYNFHIMPFIGYDPYFQFELEGRSKRKKYGLPPKRDIPELEDSQARRYMPMGKDSEWIDFEAVLSTSPDQIMITSGDLIRTWTENERRYFHYKSQGQILKHLAFLSARYEVKREKWRNVDIEIYYHKSHGTNIGLMMEAAIHSLKVFTEKFGPYQFNYLRVVEFPRYKIEAEGFPGVIPISEGYGFIAHFAQDRVEYAYRVMAHEVGHMWWGHQVLGAWMEGVFLMSETMAQYSALLVIDQKYEKKLIDDYIRREMDRYLRGRSRESTEEVPLIKTNMDSIHVHYAKGFCVMNALRNYIGEEALNKALRRYIDDTKFQTAPFTISTEFLDYLRPAVPENLRYILRDWFENITYYEARILEAACQMEESGRCRIKISFDIKKIRTDGMGNETEVPLHDLIPLGLYSKEGEELYYEKHWIHSGTGTIEITMDRKPAAAVLDPHFLLIDKNSSDNRYRLSESGSGT